MKRYIMLNLVMALVEFLVVSSAIAKDPNAPVQEQRVVKGEVTVDKNKAGDITAVYITTKYLTKYSVTLDAKGKELGTKMAGKTVEASGTVEIKDGQKWLTVEKFSEVQTPPTKSLPHHRVK